MGYNYRMSNILAATGRGQLRVLDEHVEMFDFYKETLGGLPGIGFMPEARWGRCTQWLTVITVDLAEFGATRDDIRPALEAQNIESRSVWKLMHLQPIFRGLPISPQGNFG
jgi:dTDP-4-amino-4,6-dideoxygalactose transaminase